jgi:hypothetical protein
LGASDGGLNDAEMLVLVNLYRDQKSKAHEYWVDVTGRNLRSTRPSPSGYS